jgi:hypothetical protein
MPIDENGNYECALSGVRSAPGVLYEADGLDDIPPGWVQVSFRRRLPNPDYVLVQEAKRDMINGALASVPANVPDEVRVRQKRLIELQVESQFAGVERGIAPFVLVEEIAVIAPPEDNEDLLEAVNAMRTDLGLSVLEADFLFGGKDEAASEEDEEEGDGDAADE